MLFKLTTNFSRILFRIENSVKWRLFSLSSDKKISDESVVDIVDPDLVNIKRAFTKHLLPKFGHKVLILQPARKYGIFQMKTGTEQQSVLEARALVHTLKGWSIIEEKRANIRSMHPRTFFTKGTFAELTKEIQTKDDISAVFINWPLLTSFQINNIEDAWNKVIYDRYTMVLQIFKSHCHTAESKLQLELAEIHYLRSRISSFHKHNQSEHISNEIRDQLESVALDKLSLDQKYMILQKREHSLKMKIEKLDQRKSLLSTSYSRKTIPKISVIGYTNAGKTSLIRHLSRDTKLVPEDNYFATLNVTNHDFYLKFNSNTQMSFGSKVILTDTIGFMSEIPTSLIGAFRSSLKDCMDTDLLIHVVDVSNPYWKSQMEFTIETIKSFRLTETLFESVITVGTKTDLLNEEELSLIKSEVPGIVPFSNVTGDNIDDLHATIGERLVKYLQLEKKRVKLKLGSDIYNWIRQNAIIEFEQSSSVDSNYVLLDVLFRQDIYRRFQKYFTKRSLK